ncbi:hypothetical protein JZ751_006333 [Albula glossodonta]|uniref:Uncharacterized protein n=1 Tax=Albula glossodonta TaxID=121402 RepID=A0A8T2MXY3_9TELE|nr:hypothetical protein JZ751_006333 [Albula glossodonta]
MEFPVKEPNFREKLLNSTLNSTTAPPRFSNPYNPFVKETNIQNKCTVRQQEDLEALHIAEKMLETCGSERSLKITLHILRTIKQKGLADSQEKCEQKRSKTRQVLVPSRPQVEAQKSSLALFPGPSIVGKGPSSLGGTGHGAALVRPAGSVGSGEQAGPCSKPAGSAGREQARQSSRPAKLAGSGDRAEHSDRPAESAGREGQARPSGRPPGSAGSGEAGLLSRPVGSAGDGEQARLPGRPPGSAGCREQAEPS